MIRYAVLWAPVLCAVGCGGSTDDGGAGGGASAGPPLADVCSTFCNKALELSCANDDSLAKCNADCTNLGNTIPSCADEWKSALACLVDEGILACDPMGGVSLSGCAAEQGAANTCLAVAGETACEGYCKKYVALSCTDYDQATCVSACDQALEMFCTTDSLLLYTCFAERGEFSCNAANEPQVTGCDPEQAALMECIERSAVAPSEP